jgi:hypothetical protein
MDVSLVNGSGKVSVGNARLALRQVRLFLPCHLTRLAVSETIPARPG